MSLSVRPFSSLFLATQASLICAFSRAREQFRALSALFFFFSAGSSAVSCRAGARDATRRMQSYRDARATAGEGKGQIAPRARFWPARGEEPLFPCQGCCAPCPPPRGFCQTECLRSRFCWAMARRVIVGCSGVAFGVLGFGLW